ncbi:MAG: class I SAM-dependent methyltransferase [Planctomycetota bacterium]|nr:class I SAM-dependent methyltransferase [Planctomycetota bacterium]
MKTREEIIIPLCRGRDCLDCGAADHDAFVEKQEAGTWLHARIAEVARSCLGVDLLEERVREINATGRYRFMTCDVERMEFDSEFDVVVAGELIEHLFNPGLFLDGAWRALRINGRLIITTPNPFSCTNILKTIFFGKEKIHPEHTMLFSPQPLAYIVSRHGFAVESIHLVPRPARHRIVGAVRSALGFVRPILHETIVLVAAKEGERKHHAGMW